MAKEKKASKGKLAENVGLPEGVSASLNGEFMLIKGPNGEVKRKVKRRDISVNFSNKEINFESKGETKKDKKMIKSLVAHAKNMIRGSMQDHIYVLKICSGHFPMNITVNSNKLIIKNFLGEKVPRVLELKQGSKVKVEGDLIHVTSASKETAGQVSADIEQLTRRPGYDTRIFQDGCYIINKDGKELK